MPRDTHEIFLQEAKNMFRDMDANTNVNDVPLPLICSDWRVSHKELRKIVNIPKHTGIPYMSTKTVKVKQKVRNIVEVKTQVPPISLRDIVSYYNSSLYRSDVVQFYNSQASVLTSLLNQSGSNADANISKGDFLCGIPYVISNLFITHFLHDYPFEWRLNICDDLLKELGNRLDIYSYSSDTQNVVMRIGEVLNNLLKETPIITKEDRGFKVEVVDKQVACQRVVDFSRFNGMIVTVETGIKGRRWNSYTGDFERDANGNYIRPIGSGRGTVTFSTDKALRIPYDVENTRFGYIDYEDTPEGRKYYYFVPKEYCPEVTQVALVLSNKDSKSFYSKTYHMWDFRRMSLKMVVYKPNSSTFSKDSTSTKVLYTTIGDDPDEIYESEIKGRMDMLENFWINMNVMGDPVDYESAITGVNLIIVKEKDDSADIVFKGVSDIGLRDDYDECSDWEDDENWDSEVPL